MIDLRRSDEHYSHSRSWLETEWHFSFAEYRDPDNQRFGPLRVLNNDRVAPGRGWGMHSHRDMEILTWVVEGELVHEDSTGARERVTRNGLQKMSAGRGVSHSEYNGSEREPLHLIQLWIEPDRRGIEPYYQDAVFEDEELGGGWTAVASGRSDAAPVRIEQDAELLVSHLVGDESRDYPLAPGRRAYLVALTGEGTLDRREFSAGDAARVHDEAGFRLSTSRRLELLLVDLPGDDSGRGREDSAM